MILVLKYSPHLCEEMILSICWHQTLNMYVIPKKLSPSSVTLEIFNLMHGSHPDNVSLTYNLVLGTRKDPNTREFLPQPRIPANLLPGHESGPRGPRTRPRGGPNRYTLIVPSGQPYIQNVECIPFLTGLLTIVDLVDYSTPRSLLT